MDGSLFAYAERARRRLQTLPSTELGGALLDAERRLCAVPWFDDVAVASFLVADPAHAAIALALLSDRPHTLFGERIAELFPELAGLAAPTRAATYEHQPSPADEPRPTPLLDHVFRAMRHALSLPRESLPEDPRARALFTTVLLFADVAKGGDAAMRRDWLTRLGVDGAVHNEDSAVVLGDVLQRVLRKAAPFRDDARWSLRAQALVRATGLVGMYLRGEVGRDAFAPLLAVLADEPDGGAMLQQVFSLVNRCDTAAVRDGLWTEPLARAFAEVEASIAHARSIEELPAKSLAERVARFRHGALVDDARIVEAEQSLARLGVARGETEARMVHCRTWYAEAALGALSLDGCVRLLSLLCGVAARMVDPSRAWNLDLLGVVSRLRDDRGAPRTYPVRLLETLLSSTAEAHLVEGHLGAPGAREHALVSFPAKRGPEEAVIVAMDEGEEAHALLTLLPIYERKEAAAFHGTLKALCDLYGLRKDDFDRVSNEADYLTAMNSARSDKARMIDFVVPGLIVEVGPGGGVVLDLLEGQLGGGRIVGLDASSAVVESLEKRRVIERRRWEVVHGDAFELAEIFGARTVSTVVFCSVLHEIYSYVPWPDDKGGKRRFQLESVDAIVAAAFRSLSKGGRIVVRDGVMPKHEPRVLELLDRTWRDGLDLFAKVYEPRSIPFDVLDEGRVRIDAADLYEFLTTFTWGPASFPYEIREQRAVLPRDEYVRRLLRVCDQADPPFRAREVEVPRELASYLQPGYPENVRPHARIFDQTGAEVAMPDVTGVWVIEKV